MTILTTVINFTLYATGVIMILIIGKMRPTWRGELSGVLIAVLSRTMFYAISILGQMDIVDFHGNVARLSSVFSSMFAGVILVAYGSLVIYRLRGGHGF